MQMKIPLDFLQDWYVSQCNGMWEHSYGIEIVNIDNPGWRVKINGATLKNKLNIDVDRDDLDWIKVNATDSEFVAYGAPKNLNEILLIAKSWIENI